MKAFVSTLSLPTAILILGIIFLSKCSLLANGAGRWIGVLFSTPCGAGSPPARPVELGIMDQYYLYSTAAGHPLASEGLKFLIPFWMTKTDFPYRNKPVDREIPFADGVSLVRLLGGWKDNRLPPDRRNDRNDLVQRASDGSLLYRWDLLKARMDPYVGRAMNSHWFSTMFHSLWPARTEWSILGRSVRRRIGTNGIELSGTSASSLNGSIERQPATAFAFVWARKCKIGGASPGLLKTISSFMITRPSPRRRFSWGLKSDHSIV